MLIWLGFIALLLLFLALDLGVFNRTPHVIGTREALGWTAVWVAVAMVFNVVVYFGYEGHWLGLGESLGHPLGGRDAALQFFTGYVIEKSLSLDNIFVIAMLFSYFRVPAQYQHRVLFWGILGALVFRGAMILAGAALVERFEWINYVFGGILMITAARMLFSSHDTIDLEKNLLVRLARRWFPITSEYEGTQFFVRRDGRLFMTPLWLVIVAVESSDILFAIDSIPAIFAVTRDPFIVFSSNALAILGLRSLYFALSSAMRKFRFLNEALSLILAFVGAKMLVAHFLHIPIGISLAIILGILLVGIGASCIPRRVAPEQETP